MLIDFWESNKRACSFNKLHESSKKHPGGGTPHMKGLGMLVVPLRDFFGFGSHLGCSGQNAIIFSRKGLV